MLTSARTIDVIIPVHRGEATLPALMDEIAPFTTPSVTPGGREFEVRTVVLVHDRGPDRSDRTIAALAARLPWVHPVWLGRNSGQHPATLAGVAASTSEWVVTMDEDGLHDPSDIPRLLDTAIDARVHVVYGRGSNTEPHGALRRAASRSAKRVYRRLLVRGAPHFTSFRLVLGEVIRTVAVTANHGVYLDAAITWATDRVAETAVVLRDEGRPADGYTFARLRAHFGRLVLSSGPGPLRHLAGVGTLTAASGVGLAIWVVARRIGGAVDVQGWASLMAALLLFSGLLLLTLSAVAGYLALLVTAGMGRPLYSVVSEDATVFR